MILFILKTLSIILALAIINYFVIYIGGTFEYLGLITIISLFIIWFIYGWVKRKYFNIKYLIIGVLPIAIGIISKILRDNTSEDLIMSPIGFVFGVVSFELLLLLFIRHRKRLFNSF